MKSSLRLKSLLWTLLLHGEEVYIFINKLQFTP